MTRFVDSCSPPECEHVVCRVCSIGHGSIKVPEDRICESCRAYYAGADVDGIIAQTAELLMGVPVQYKREQPSGVWQLALRRRTPQEAWIDAYDDQRPVIEAFLSESEQKRHARIKAGFWRLRKRAQSLERNRRHRAG